MSVTTPVRTRSQAPVDVPPVGRRSRWRVAAGVLVVIATTALFVAWNTAAADTTGVLVVTRPVPLGQPISAADVRVAQMRLEPGMDVVTEAQAGQVMGRPAAVPLVAGAVLSAGQLGRSVVPSAGQVLVAVPVPLPPVGLAAGARVRVLVTGTGGQGAVAAPADDALGLVTPVATATVVEVGLPDGAGAPVVSLLLPADAGDRVAAAAAMGQVSLVVEAVG